MFSSASSGATEDAAPHSFALKLTETNGSPSIWLFNKFGLARKILSQT
jgi:hypothetical protein